MRAVLGHGFRRSLRTLLLLAGAWAAPGCSQAPQPEAVPVQQPAGETEATGGAPPETGAEEAAEAAGAESGPPAEEAEPDPTVILIERRHRQREEEPRTLYEAAVAARKERAEAGASRVSVTDENLHEFQGEGLTFAEEGAEEEGAEGEAAGGDGSGEAPAASSEEAGGETYWRSRVRDLRLALREAVDAVAELEERAASLRRSFYAQDDPYVRDAEIKPAWDRTLDRIADTRAAVFRLREELDATLEAGRRAGALPGWLREGKELEPQETAGSERRDPAEPVEPDVIERTDESVEPKEGQQ